MRDFVAQAYNAAMPTYDLVIIDEAHNLKGGVQIRDGVVGGGALRNAVLAQVLGHPEVTPHPLFADTYRPLADRVLLLSATPVEESFRNLWNQLHLVGKHAPEGRTDFAALKDNDEQARETAARVLVRRINTVEIGGVRHTKSQYRRTWHQGGIGTHDEPLSAGTIRQRLSVALVQKKVSDLIGTKFNNQFQMGMLASFESFAETALKQPKASDEGTGAADDEGPADGNFDGDQTTDPVERLGIDTSAVNHLARHHFDTFGVELAHPKMDALVTDLARSWRTGEKALVFVRRVASVTEIKRKLDETYDEWLLERLEGELPPHVWTQVHAAHDTYLERRAAEGRHLVGPGDGDRDAGGADTFFAWFFRGEGPELTPASAGGDPIESGASLARRLGMASGAASTFFAEHYLADLLDCRPDEVLDQLAEALGESPETVANELEERARHYLPASAGRRHTFDAVQAAGLELLRNGVAPLQPLQEAATVLIGELQLAPGDRRTLAFDVRRQLTTPTFFTRLLDHRELAEALLPTAAMRGRDKTWVREHYVRTALLTAALRLGQPLIDLYGAFMQVSTRGSVTDNNEVDAAIDQFLALLERQRSDSAPVGALAELASISRDFDLLRHQNLPSTTREEFLLAAAGAECGTLMGKQQPTVGMAGRVNQTAVRQFRMPGYPYALICTDVLQEGEDLHTYCDRVIHYGVAWTASAMEQRTGRVDRINSLAERRFVELQDEGSLLDGHDKIQVQLPYLTETVERVQARTVLRRMHTFISLMHHGVDSDERRLDLATEILNDDWLPPQVEQPLESAFDVNPADLKGRSRGRLASDDLVEEWWSRLVRIAQARRPKRLLHEGQPGPRTTSDVRITRYRRSRAALLATAALPRLHARGLRADSHRSSPRRRGRRRSAHRRTGGSARSRHRSRARRDPGVRRGDRGRRDLGRPRARRSACAGTGPEGHGPSRPHRVRTDSWRSQARRRTDDAAEGHRLMTTEPNAPSWRFLALGLGDLPPDEDVIVMDLGAGRSHAVDVVYRDDVWELSGMVGTSQDLERASVSAIDLWRLNSQRCLTNYVVEADGTAWVTALAPVAGLTAEEFAWLARLVAFEADRLEYRLTGDDAW